MAKHEFNSNNQPVNRKVRGKSERSKIIESMKRLSKSENSFYDMLVTRAYDPNDTFGASEILKRISPIKRQTMPMIEFDFDDEAHAHIQAAQVMKATSQGLIAPDVANMFISSISSMMKIQEATDMNRRIEEIELSLGVGNG
jgi:hypothetical protein